jgi:hypothetical protein
VLLARLGGFLDGPVVHVDARQQLAVIANMSEDDLRALAHAARRNGTELVLPELAANGPS